MITIAGQAFDGRAPWRAVIAAARYPKASARAPT